MVCFKWFVLDFLLSENFFDAFFHLVLYLSTLELKKMNLRSLSGK